VSTLRDVILQHVDLVELIGQWVALTHAGREWRGRCPFHDEKTPSFYVNAEKGVFHCHGCKAGGTAIDFVMRIEHLEFIDALDWFVQRYNIPRPERQSHGGAGAGSGATGVKARLFELNAAAASFFRQSLTAPLGEAARTYLTERGIAAREVADFDLGYAPREWQALGDALLARGAKAQELVQLGLIRPRQGDSPAGAGGEGRGHFDMFRHRLMFPIRNVTGRIIGFAGRALSAEDTPKYLNTAATPLYDKSGVLYNLDRAKGHLRDQGAVVVEGYMDVIGLAAAGIPNAVASCGTALTEQHVRLLARYTDRFYLCFDSDRAGREAAWSAGKLFLHAGYDARVINLGAAKDPDDWAKQQAGDTAAAWQDLVQHSHSVVRYWLDHQQGLHPQADATTQRGWVVQLRGLYQGVPDELLRHDIQREVASALRIGAQEVAGLLDAKTAALPHARRPGGRAETKQRAQQRALLQGQQPLEDEFARRLLADEQFRLTCLALAGDTTQPLAEEDFLTIHGPREILAALRSGADANQLLYDEQHAAYAAAVLTGERGEPLQDSNEQLLLRLCNDYYQRQVDGLMIDYADAETAGDEAALRALGGKIQEIKRRIRPLSGLGTGG
jgi:DNA primase